MSSDALNVEAYVSHVLANSPKADEPTNSSSLCAYVSSVTEAQRRQWTQTHVDAAFNALNHATHTVAFIPLLHSRLSSSSAQDGERVVELIQQLIDNANVHQLRHTPRLLVDLLTEVLHKNIERSAMHTVCLRLFYSAICTLRKTEEEWTRVHPLLCCMALKARHFDEALLICDVNITSISNEPHVDRTLPFLAYYYYAGCIYLAHEEYDRSMFMLQIVMTTPSHTLSHVQLHAFKKYLLVSLIANGRMVENWASFRSPCVYRSIRQQPNIVAYEGLVEHVVKRSANIRQFVAKHAAEYAKDRNTALIERVLRSIVERHVRHIITAFTRIRIVDLARRAECTEEEALCHVRALMAKRAINAKLVDGDAMLVVEEGEEATDDGRVLEEGIDEALRVSKMLAKIDNDIKTDTVYVSKLVKAEQSSKQMPQQAAQWNDGYN